MIDEVQLQNVALIREASLAPHRRLTVLTGETGSGKTAFLQGLKLLLGERASADMVRSDAEELTVLGRFFTEGGSEDGIIAQRSVSADGRSRVRIDGGMASVGDLATTVGAGVDLCGQHEHQRLAKPSNHGDILDEWIGEPFTQAHARYLECFDRARQAERAYREFAEADALDGARLEEAQFIVRRIGEVAPQPGEYEELLAEAKRLGNIEELMQATGGARDALSGEGGAIDSLGRAFELLDAARSFDARIAEQAQALREASYVLEDAARGIDALIPDAESFDPRRIDELQERLAGYQALMRSYGPEMEQVFARLEEAEEIVSGSENRGERLAALDRERARCEEELGAAASELSQLRRDAAPRFASEVNAWLARLEMPEGALLCTVEPLERSRWSTSGADMVSFMFRPGSGLEPRALSRIASGGEMSRVTLAIKAVIGSTDKVETLVFDEVDAGIGGKTALTVADALAGLAQTHQVIVVTHLAQIAVMADAHYVVEKQAGPVPETQIRQVSGSDRVREIARMLSGSNDAASLVHAEGLLREAQTR